MDSPSIYIDFYFFIPRENYMDYYEKNTNLIHIFKEDLIMMKKFKEFFVSYWELTKASCRWVKEHWLGYTILCIIMTLWQLRGCIKTEIKWAIQKRKWKKIENSSKEEESI